MHSIALPNPLNPTQELRSPQNQFNKAQINCRTLVQQSGGFEGMAISPDGQYLYPLIEKPIKSIRETERQLLISQFDVKKKAYIQENIIGSS